MQNEGRRLLTIDDSENAREFIRKVLGAAGYTVIEAESGPIGVEQIRNGAPDLVLLDLQMPGEDGFATLKKIRAFWHGPVIVVSAREDVDAKVQALDLGADDYVAKPFDTEELLARLRASLRRGQTNEEIINWAGLTLRYIDRHVTRGEKMLHLSPMEFKLLWIVLQRRGSVVSRRQIAEEIWGHDDEHVQRSLRVLVRKLRAKIEQNPESPDLIQTEPGIGYRCAG